MKLKLFLLRVFILGLALAPVCVHEVYAESAITSGTFSIDTGDYGSTYGCGVSGMDCFTLDGLYSITYIATSSRPAGSTVFPGDVITFSVPYDSTQLVWSATGGAYDTPYGYWDNQAISYTNIPGVGDVGFGVPRSSAYAFGTNLSCGMTLTCTVTGTGTISANVNFPARSVYVNIDAVDNYLGSYHFFTSAVPVVNIPFTFTSVDPSTGTTITVKRGPQSPKAQLNWSIVGGGSSCTGSTNYPSLADNIKSFWDGSRTTVSGVGSTTNLGDGAGLFWGTSFLAPATGSPGYEFSCSRPDLGITAKSYIIVADCSLGETWNGTSCVIDPTGTLDVSSPTCVVSVGSSTCSVNLTWNTNNPQGTSDVTRTNPDGQAFGVVAGNSGGPSSVTVSASSSSQFFLYNNGILLDSVTVTPTCSQGGWDTVSQKCVNPQVFTSYVSGNYNPPPANLFLRCNSESSGYLINKMDDSMTVMLSGTYATTSSGYNVVPVTVPTLTGGDYRFTCSRGSYSGSSVLRNYDPTPSSPIVKLMVSPANISSNEGVSVIWETKYPTSTCALTAKVICTNNSCTDDQTAFQATVDTMLASEFTDASDAATSRSIPVAVNTLAPGEDGTTYRALGRKTFKVKYSTDMTYSCGGTATKTKRIRVSGSSEN